jgi:hypothetical protein
LEKPEPATTETTSEAPAGNVETQTPQAATDTPSDSKETEIMRSGQGYRYTCDACGRGLSYTKGFYKGGAGYLALDLCPSCWQLLQDGKLPVSRCPSDTKFFRVVHGGLPYVPFGKVRFEGVNGGDEEMIDLAEWYDQLRAEWRPKESSSSA